jgi:hypothetical protein
MVCLWSLLPDEGQKIETLLEESGEKQLNYLCKDS